MASRPLSVISAIVLMLLLLALAFSAPWASTSFAQEPASATMTNFSFSPATLTIPVGTTVTWTNQDPVSHTTTSTTGLWDSGTLNQGQSFSFTFTGPGTFPYICEIHPFMQGTVVVAQAATPTPPAAASNAPALAEPGDGARLTTFGPTLSWTNPPNVTQYHLQVIPANNDGPGVDLHVGAPETSFAVPPPPQWFGLLPDMTYTWRLRVSNAATFVGLEDPSWSPWSERQFRTPAVASATISAVAPAEGTTVSTLTPTLQWANSRSDIFYYEVQLSKDQTFNTDPGTATAMVYGELRHGGATSPPNSYTVPSNFPLERDTTYFWRVRPRVQGDGKSVDWSAVFSFTTEAAAPRTTPTSTMTATPTPSPTATRTPIATATPAPSPTATPGAMSEYRIAFTPYGDGNYEVYIVNADGSGLRNLSNNTAYDGAHAWSPR